MNKREAILSDKELWMDFISGNEDAFKTIYEKYFYELFRYGCHFSGDENLIKDCIQDLFVNLYKYRTKLSLTNKIRPYLLASFKRNILKKLQDNSVKKERILRIESFSFDYSLVEETSDYEDDKTTLLQNAIEKLTARQKEAIYLKYVVGLSYEELSATMNLSYQASRNLICQATERLRKVILNKYICYLSIFSRVCLISRKRRIMSTGYATKIGTAS